MNGIECYQLYLTLKLHFSGSYNFFKYQGKIKNVQDRFRRARGRFLFMKLAKRFRNKEEAMDFFVANLLKDPKVWVGDLLSDEAREVYLEWVKRKESITYFYTSDIENLFQTASDKDLSPKDLFVVPEGGHPILLQMFLRGEIQLDTLVILDRVIKFLKVWKKELEGDPIWEEIKNKIEKVDGFIEADINRCRDETKKIARKFS